MGLGAASLIDGTRFSNVRDLKQYTDCFEQAGKQGNAETACKDPVDKETVEVLTEAGKMAEFMFLGLRLVKGVEKAEFTRRFGKSAEAVYGDIIRKHVREGLLKDENGRIALTERGLDLSNTVMCDFLPE